MFGNIGWGEMMVIVVAALVILGPERLPGAIAWVTRSIRQVREYATGATQQLRDELGPEFDELRKPLAEINELRNLNPRSMITKHILDGDDSLLTGNFDGKPDPLRKKAEVYKEPAPATERPPIDPDAT